MVETPWKNNPLGLAKILLIRLMIIQQ